ncbi:MAG: hypothetical protein E7678_03460 [Ruminococcaceae bacterium]|nr:hypothetical protein [Oscillospiraceae bacterium]
MKKIISCLLLAALLLASVIAMIPASAATAEDEFNLMYSEGTQATAADNQFAGEGNVFYYDYYKYLDLGNTFPVTDTGNTDYMIRYRNAGTGSASVCDGVKNTSNFSHDPGTSENSIGEITYNQIFGYSFKESVVADAITMYLPAETPITDIDVYGSRVDKANKIFAKEAERTFLASFTKVNETTPVDEAGTQVIKLEADLNEAFLMDYVFLAVKVSGSYKFYEIELNGILAKDAADFTALKTQYARYKDLVPEHWKNWDIMAPVLAETDPINKNATSTADEIATAAAALKNAIDSLKPVPANTTELEKLISDNATLVKEEYTAASWATYETALNAANTIVVDAKDESKEISQADVNNALANLQAAIKGLAKPADKTALAAQIAKVDTLEEEDYYTPATWEALQTPIANAVAVNANAEATQDEVDAATETLKKAIEKLAKKADKTALSEAVENAKTLKQKDYNVTAFTWNTLMSKIEDAEALIANINATQAEVDFALSELKDKIESLKPITPGSSNTDNKDEADKGEDKTDDATDAGDATDATDVATQQATVQIPPAQAPAATTAPAKKGCGSSVAVSALAILGVVGTAVVLKKKED